VVKKDGFMMLILVVILKIKPLMKYQQMLINLEDIVGKQIMEIYKSVL
jgi:hypothetical protein